MPKPTVPNALFQAPAKRAAPAKPTSPQYNVVTVTPERAQEWLETANGHNRHPRPTKVAAYARDMAAGNWAENGEAIKFAADGTLLDGQHRLAAIVESGATLRLLVVSGLPMATQETMDAGAKRTLADALYLRGEAHHVNLAALIKRAFLWSKGMTSFKSSTQLPTNAECLMFLEREPRLRECAEVGALLGKTSGVTAATLGFVHWLFSGIDAEDARWFFERLSTGVGLEERHPILALRKRFADDAKAPSRMPEEMAVALLIKGWNAYRAGERVQILRFVPGGSSPEKFPMPK